MDKNLYISSIYFSTFIFSFVFTILLFLMSILIKNIFVKKIENIREEISSTRCLVRKLLNGVDDKIYSFELELKNALKLLLGILFIFVLIDIITILLTIFFFMK